MKLQVTDLFKKYGHNFDWVSRISDQNKLIERMKEFSVLEKHIEEFNDFANEGIVSLNYLDYFYKGLTKTCSQNNIQLV